MPGSNFDNEIYKLVVSEIQSLKNAGVIPEGKNLNAEGITAQIILETGHGKSDLFKSANNFGGIKADANWTGDVHTTKDGLTYRKYNSIEEGLKAQIGFYLENPRYENAGALSTSSAEEWASAIKKAGYAEDPDYVKKVSQIAKKFSMSNDVQEDNSVDTSLHHAYKPLQHIKVGNTKQLPIDVDFSVSGENMKTENKVNYKPMSIPGVNTSFTGQQSLFKDGGPLNISGPVAEEQPINIDAMNAMMKARMATSAELGNPSAKRMTSPNPKTYDFGNGNLGTHYMGSFGNYAVPFLQDKGGENLEYIENPIPSKEDMRFETDEEAAYFAEHYKEVAPMMNNFKLGGNMYRRFDLGGPMQGMPSKGQAGQLTSFDTGGSHEENELGGIPQGMNPNGQQNLVEEGETKLNSKSYIFSDTLKLDKDTAKEFYFPNKYVGKTFAEISKLMDNSKSRRVNDSIEENAKRKDLDSLMYAQEEFKQKDLEKDMQNMMIKHPEFMQSMMAPQMPQEQPIDPSMMQQGTEQGLPMQSPMAKFGGYQNQMDFGGFMNKVGQVGKNYGLALADNALGAVGANNVIKDSDYAGAGADFARSAQKVTGAITNIGAGIATNALLPGVGGSVLGGVQGAMSGAGGENTVLQNGQVVPQRQMSNGGGLGKKLSFSLPTNLENDNFGIPVEGDTRLAFQLGDLSNDTFIAPEATPIAKNNSGILDVNYAGTEMSNMNPDAISKKDAKINKRLLKSTSNTNTDNTDNTDNTIDLENYFFDITDNTEDDNTKRTYDLEDGPQKQTYNQSLLNAAATYAPAVYNIGMGLFSKAQKLNPEDYINRTQIKNYRENINPQLRSSDEAMAGAKKGLRNSGASSGAYLANLQALHSQDQAMKAGLYANNENQYLARQLQVDQLNAARKDQANAMALQIADYNARAAAAKQKMLQEGISQVGNIAKSDTSNKLATMFNNLYAPDFKDYATYNSYLETLKKQAQNKKKKD